MASKALAIGFVKVDRRTIRGKVGHSRTGACPSQGKCYHGWRHHQGRAKGKKG